MEFLQRLYCWFAGHAWLPVFENACLYRQCNRCGKLGDMLADTDELVARGVMQVDSEPIEPEIQAQIDSILKPSFPPQMSHTVPTLPVQHQVYGPYDSVPDMLDDIARRDPECDELASVAAEIRAKATTLPDKSNINPPLGSCCGCGCYRCRKDRELPRESFGNDFSAWHLQSANARMILCAKCGCKRCPHATDHRNECTDSNASGQVGSQFHPDFTTSPATTLPIGPPDTTEGDEPTRLSEPSTAPVPHPAAHDALAARGRSYFQPHIAKGQ